MKHIIIGSLCICYLLLAVRAEEGLPSREALTVTAAARDARLGWWREARFGMFVHWGVYSYLGGDWQGKPYSGYAEHIQRMAKIPIPVYRQEVAGHFNPTNFNADEWIRLAKETGMGYFIITAKHHDGFAMWPTKVNDYNIMDATPWHHDPMADLRAACKKYGVKFGFYYSHAFDWGDANAPGNDWDYGNPGGDKGLHGANWWENYPEFLPKARKYVDEKAIPQILELIHNYDPDILWFDTPQKLPPEEDLRILAAVRKAKPSLVVNSRIINVPDVDKLVDYLDTADRPAEIRPTPGDWEGIPTTDESYAYNQNDHSHKPASFFIRLLAKAAARGGNILMNIGPMGNGQVDPADVAILKGVGAWWKVNGESIRGTTRTLLPVQAWGESTRKGNTLYLHVFDWPSDGKLVVGGLKTDVKAARILGATTEHISVARLNPLDVILSGLPANAPSEVDSVIELYCAAEPQADTTRLLSTSVREDTLRSFDAKLEGNLQFGPGKSGDAWVKNWTRTNDAVVWPVRLNEKATFEASLIYDAPTDSQHNRVAEGDAGKEVIRATKGAGGVYQVTLGSHNITKAVKAGLNVNEPLGRVTLESGAGEIRVTAKEIGGEELFRLRAIELKPLSSVAGDAK